MNISSSRSSEFSTRALEYTGKTAGWCLLDYMYCRSPLRLERKTFSCLCHVCPRLPTFFSDEGTPEHPENQELSSRRARAGHTGCRWLSLLPTAVATAVWQFAEPIVFFMLLYRLCLLSCFIRKPSHDWVYALFPGDDGALEGPYH